MSMFLGTQASLALANIHHRLYMWTFQDAIRAGAGSIMCSYNQLNGSYGCQNSKSLNGLLKGELGFKVCIKIQRRERSSISDINL